MTTTRQAPARLRTAAEVAEQLRVPVSTLYAWRYRGTGPRAFRVGRWLRYDEADVDAWIAAQRQHDPRTA